MKLPANSPRPPYQLAADQIREDIRTGSLRPGDRLPSARELKEELGIANATVHAALKVLKDEGLIYSVHGRGTYIAESDHQGASTFGYTPPAWHKPVTPEPLASSKGETEAAGTDQLAPPGEQTSEMVDFVIGLRDHMRSMSAQITGLTQRVAQLEAKPID